MRMDKQKHDVGQTAASNDKSEERSENKEDDSVSKLASPDEGKERNIVKFTTTVNQLEIENKKLKQCVFKAKQELSQEIKTNKKDMRTVIEDKITAISKYAANEESIEQQKIFIEEMTRHISNLEDRIQQVKKCQEQRGKKYNSLTESIKRIEQLAGEREKTIKAQKEGIKHLEQQAEEREKTIKAQKERINLLTKQVSEKDATISRQQSRLSKIAGANLAFQNPNIADLGDPNRPTKLSERFSELYENQWTDAFEQLDLQDVEEKIKRLYAILKKLDRHCLDVCWNYDTAVKESLTNLTVTSEILKPERTQEAENDTGFPSENGVKIPSEKDTTFSVQEESKEEMTGSAGLCNTYLWHKKETEDIGGGCKMIKYRNDNDVKCISPESMTGSECTGHVPAEGNKEEKRAEEKEGGKEETDEGKGGITEGKIESGSFKQTGRFKAEKKIERDLSDENNEYNPDVKSENGSSETAPDIKKDTQEYEDDTDCKKIDNRAEKEGSHVELAYQNDKSAEFKSDFNVKTEGNECTDDITQHDVESKEEKQTKQDEHKENVIYLKFDFDTLTNSHEQTISEIRRIVHTQLEDQVVKAISQAVVEEMELPRETGIVSYVEECTKICWLARLHDPPVYIEFEEIKDDLPFKAEMYKAYTKTGKRLDYVVWPPVFLYKNGPMLTKGVAQGK